MFFDVIARPQTWRNIGYLLLAFPLGIFYFVFFVTGFSLGMGLFITLLGIPILVGVLWAAYGMGEFERVTTNLLLDQDTQPSYRLTVPDGWWEKVKALIRSSETWKRIGYLLIEFPFGIISFTLVTTTAAIFALVTTPFFYAQSWWLSSNDWLTSWWVVDTLWEAVLVALGAVLIGFVLLHVINGLAKGWGAFAQAMLGPSVRPMTPVEGVAPTTEVVPQNSTRPKEPSRS